ncbi:MAG: hypothetical protein WAO09_07410 [Candidatus Dormiibacterota bacterium]
MTTYADLPHPHGTVSGWHHGCRCADCRGAHAAEVARYRAKRPFRSGAEVPHPSAPALAAGPRSELTSTEPSGSGGTLALAVVALLLILGVIALAARRG